MEIVNPRSPEVEIHVKMTRKELEDLVSDMDAECTNSNPYDVTEDFMNYLRRL